MQEYLKKLLNEQQYQAAMKTDWASLILAWAWSGKTRTLTYKIAYMSFLWISSSNILAVTFTNKAAKEMKERLFELDEEIKNQNFNQENLQEKNENDFDFVQEDVDEEQESIDSFLQEYDTSTQSIKTTQTRQNYNRIGTFHSIFLRILKQDIEYLNEILNSKYTKNFNIADEWDSLSVIRKILKSLNIADVRTPKEVKRKISALKNLGKTAKSYQKEVSSDDDALIGKIYQKYENEMREQNLLDFDDLLLLVYVLFKNNSQILEKRQDKFKYILVDEAQDTNKIQFDLIYILSKKNGNITLIGDDFQSIYGRRWAVIEDFLNAKKYRPDLQIFKLETNYRSKKTIVEAWNAIIANNKNQYEKNIKSHTDKESKIRIVSYPSDSDEAVQVVNLIKKLHEKWKKRSDFAIIYRTNAQSEPFEKVLLTDNIPYKVYGAFKFYQRKEVKDILSYIKYLVNPADWTSLTRIINTPSRKIWQTTIDKLSLQAQEQNVSLHEILQNKNNANINAGTQNNINWFNEIINYIKEKNLTQSPSATINTIVKVIEYEKFLEKENWKESTSEKMWNIWQLMNIAENFQEKWIAGLNSFLDEISLFTDLEQESEQSLEQVQLMTAHSSKWLEFDTVFITGLEENVFPLPKARLNPKELEEERRLMYVWITRAKNNLFITYAEARKQYWNLKYNPPSRFINEIPQELITSFNSKIDKTQNLSNFQIHDRVKHKLFGIWEVMEVFQDKVIVRFYGAWIKQIISAMLEKI